MTLRLANHSAWILGYLLLTAALTGCGAGDIGATLSDRPQPMKLTKPETRTIAIPASTPFSITLAPSQKKPELNGTAYAESTAKNSGQAKASASIEGGGTASAAFQIGHALRNDSERLLDLRVSAKLHYKYAVAADSSTLPLAGVHVNLFARDDRNRSLAKFNFVAHTSDNGAVTVNDGEQLDFTITLGPGRTASIYLAGTVQINAEDGHTASGSIDLDSFELEITTQPAPAVKAASDG